MKESLRKEAKAIGNGFYSINAPGRIGYLFNPSFDGKTISNGMFCNRKEEINKDEWTYFMDLAGNIKTIR
jgi:hypothetical protein